MSGSPTWAESGTSVVLVTLGAVPTQENSLKGLKALAAQQGSCPRGHQKCEKEREEEEVDDTGSPRTPSQENAADTSRISGRI